VEDFLIGLGIWVMSVAFFMYTDGDYIIDLFSQKKPDIAIILLAGSPIILFIGCIAWAIVRPDDKGSGDLRVSGQWTRSSSQLQTAHIV